MKKIILLTILFVSQVAAQSIGGGFMIGSPRGEYKHSNPHTGYGLQIQGMLINPSEESPFGIGLDLGFLIYSSESEARPFSHTIPDVLVDVTRRNSMANMHLVFQVSPFHGRIQPYAELYGGGSYIYTTTEIEDIDIYDHVAVDVNYDDFAWSYGAGGGLKVLVSNPDFYGPEIFIDFKVRFLAGSTARFLTTDDVIVKTGTSSVHYFPRESETDLLTFTIGAEVRF